ncbi:hypothetical protein D3C72_1318210 [compost metagenome]
MSLPAIPASYLVLVESNLAFRLLEAAFYRPAHAGDPNHLFQRRVTRSSAQEKIDLTVGDPPPEQSPAPPWLRGVWIQRSPGPVVPTRSLLALARTEPMPVGLADLCQHVRDSAPCHSARYVARHSEDEGTPLSFEPAPKLAVLAVGLVACDPTLWRPALKGPRQHVLPQLRLCRERHALRNSCLLSSSRIVGPVLGQEQSSID